jgi:HlyD family secretion protein
MKQGSGFLGTVLKLFVLLLLIGLLGGAGWFGWGYYTTTNQSFTFKTEKVVKGDLTATVSSTGTIEPEEVIDIGALLSLPIIKFGPDPEDSTKTVDWCTKVEAGSVLAVLDDALYVARRNEAAATVRSAEADLVAKKAIRDQADREWNRNVQLKPRGGVSNTDYDTALANYETSKAAVGVSEAAVGLARAQLAEAEVNLGYTVIKSPVKGIIIDRRVNVGQTVVAGISAPSLFLLAKDLTRVQVWVSVNEADIGQIKKGQTAKFTCDAFPGEEFIGTVTKVRLNAMMTQNVVTYTVEVTTPNKDMKLMPYLTANVKFLVDKREGVKLIPNAALRWRPPVAHVHPDYRSEYEQSLKRRAAAMAEGGASKSNEEKNQQNRGTVWIEEEGFARPVKVHTGLTDSLQTEVLEVLDKDKNILDVDTPVITGVSQGNANAGTVNPFAPKMFGGAKK